MGKITITESDGQYEIERGEVSDFELIGLLECVVFDLKNNRPRANSAVQKVAKPSVEPSEEMKIDVPKLEDIKTSATVVPDIRTRISNAVKAIKSLGGQIEDFDLNNATEDELQVELEALTEQYKRLKAKSKK